MTTIKRVGKPMRFTPEQTGPNSIAVPSTIKTGAYYELTCGDQRKEIVISGDYVAQAIGERGLIGKQVTLQEVILN